MDYRRNVYDHYARCNEFIVRYRRREIWHWTQMRHALYTCIIHLCVQAPFCKYTVYNSCWRRSTSGVFSWLRSLPESKSYEFPEKCFTIKRFTIIIIPPCSDNLISTSIKWNTSKTRDKKKWQNLIFRPKNLEATGNYFLRATL